MSDTEKFVYKLQECVHNREPITLFGVDYAPMDDIGLLETIIAGIDEENAKLRELVRDMWRGMCNSYSRNCFACKHYPRTASQKCECEFRTRMRELGIEVDDA